MNTVEVRHELEKVTHRYARSIVTRAAREVYGSDYSDDFMLGLDRGSWGAVVKIAKRYCGYDRKDMRMALWAAALDCADRYGYRTNTEILVVVNDYVFG